MSGVTPASGPRNLPPLLWNSSKSVPSFPGPFNPFHEGTAGCQSGTAVVQSGVGSHPVSKVLFLQPFIFGDGKHYLFSEGEDNAAAAFLHHKGQLLVNRGFPHDPPKDLPEPGSNPNPDNLLERFDHVHFLSSNGSH